MNDHNKMDDRLKQLEHVGTWIQDLEDDQVSMAWRADLNERLSHLHARPRSRFLWLWKPALGLGLAGALTLAILMKPEPDAMPTAQGEGALTARLVNAHQEALAAQDLGTASLEKLDSDQGSVVPTWDDLDLSTL